MSGDGFADTDHALVTGMVASALRKSGPWSVEVVDGDGRYTNVLTLDCGGQGRFEVTVTPAGGEPKFE